MSELEKYQKYAVHKPVSRPVKFEVGEDHLLILHGVAVANESSLGAAMRWVVAVGIEEVRKDEALHERINTARQRLASE